MNLIDWNQFNEIVDFGDPDGVEIFDDFAADVPNHLDELRGVCEDGNHEEAARLAHRLRGGCSTFGFCGMASLLETLELSAKDGGAIEPAQWYAMMVGAFNGARSEVELRRAKH